MVGRVFEVVCRIMGKLGMQKDVVVVQVQEC